jgi:DDE domain
MATIKLLTDFEANAIPAVKAVFDDIRATRKSDFVNNFWRGLANESVALKRAWEYAPALRSNRSTAGRNAPRATDSPLSGRVGWPDGSTRVAPADFLLVTTNDAALSEIGSQILSMCRLRPGSVVCHCSGATSSERLWCKDRKQSIFDGLATFARLSGSRADCRIRSRSMVIWLHIARRSRLSAKHPKCKIRSSKYLNNLIEQDHRSIKLRLGPMLGLKHFRRAATTIAGIELMHRIRRSVQTGSASHQKQNRI